MLGGPSIEYQKLCFINTRKKKRLECVQNLIETSGRRSLEHMLQATATLRMLLENNADEIPHKTKMLDSWEKLV